MISRDVCPIVALILLISHSFIMQVHVGARRADASGPPPPPAEIDEIPSLKVDEIDESLHAGESDEIPSLEDLSAQKLDEAVHHLRGELLEAERLKQALISSKEVPDYAEKFENFKKYVTNGLVKAAELRRAFSGFAPTHATESDYPYLNIIRASHVPPEVKAVNVECAKTKRDELLESVRRVCKKQLGNNINKKSNNKKKKGRGSARKQGSVRNITTDPWCHELRLALDDKKALEPMILNLRLMSLGKFFAAEEESAAAEGRSALDPKIFRDAPCTLDSLQRDLTDHRDQMKRLHARRLRCIVGTEDYFKEDQRIKGEEGNIQGWITDLEKHIDLYVKHEELRKISQAHSLVAFERHRAEHGAEAAAAADS